LKHEKDSSGLVEYTKTDTKTDTEKDSPRFMEPWAVFVRKAEG
jgi:hypothetical protein